MINQGISNTKQTESRAPNGDDRKNPGEGTGQVIFDFIASNAQ